MIKTVTLQTAKALKENGFPQGTYMTYGKLLNREGYGLSTTEEWDSVAEPFTYAAPTTDELLDRCVSYVQIHKAKGIYHVMFGLEEFNHVSLPEGLAQMYLWLKQQNLIK